jgi:SAM-dependent methyltransferase
VATQRLTRIRTQLKALPWVVRSAILDLRYGGLLAGDIKSRHRAAGAYNVINSPYSVLPHMFAGRVGEDDVLVDVGCGKGRVINWWLSRGLRNRLVGIEMDPELAAAVAERLRRYPNVEIIAGDATSAIPDDATLLYLYNSFDGPSTERFKATLAERFGHRGITILYWNTQWLDLWRDDPDWNVDLVPLDDVADPRIGGSHGHYAVISLPAHGGRFERPRTMARPRAV